MNRINVQVRQCATFELEFNSVITGTASYISGNLYVQGQGMIVSYDMDGRLVHKWKSLGYSKFLETGRLLTGGSSEGGG